MSKSQDIPVAEGYILIFNCNYENILPLAKLSKLNSHIKKSLIKETKCTKMAVDFDIQHHPITQTPATSTCFLFPMGARVSRVLP